MTEVTRGTLAVHLRRTCPGLVLTQGSSTIYMSPIEWAALKARGEWLLGDVTDYAEAVTPAKYQKGRRSSSGRSK